MSRQPPSAPTSQQRRPTMDDKIRQPGQGLRRPTEDRVQLHPSHGRGGSYPDDEKRQSGMGGIGMGMLAGGDSDDDDDDDDDRRPQPPPQRTNMPQRPPPARQGSQGSHGSPPRMNGGPAQQRPPGLNPPMPVMSPPPPGPISRPTQALQPAPQLAQPRAAFMPMPPPQHPLRPGTTEPHALHSPSTPIVAKFQLHTDDPSKNRTTVFGDEFWTRFNKAAKDEQVATQRQSKNSFLREYSGGAGRMSKWIWCCSIVLLLAIVGGIVAGWYFSRNEPAAAPAVFGGSDNENSLTPSVPGKTSSPAAAPAGSTSTSTPDRRRHASHRRRLGIDQLN